jgi:hypothetical protein
MDACTWVTARADPTARHAGGKQGEQREERTPSAVADRLTARAERHQAHRQRRCNLASAPITDKIYGSATITEVNGALQLTFQPAKDLLTGTLGHWHYDTFQWQHADPFLEPGYITFTFDADP